MVLLAAYTALTRHFPTVGMLCDVFHGLPILQIVRHLAHPFPAL